LINLIAPQHDPRYAGVICSSFDSSNISRAPRCQMVGRLDVYLVQCEDDARICANLTTDSVFSITVSRSGYPRENLSPINALKILYRRIGTAYRSSASSRHPDDQLSFSAYLFSSPKVSTTAAGGVIIRYSPSICDDRAFSL
jgi:hypothetical protein